MEKMFTGSIKTRWTISILVVVFFIALVSAILLLIEIRSNMRRDFHLKVLSQGKLAVVSATPSGTYVNVNQLKSALRRYVKADNEVAYAAVTIDCKVPLFFASSVKEMKTVEQFRGLRYEEAYAVSSSGRNCCGSVRPTYLGDKEYLEAIQPLLFKDGTKGCLRLGFVTHFLRSDLLSSANIMLIFVIGGLLVAVFVSFRLGERFSRPVRKLAKAAERYSKENFSLDLEMARHGEFRVLSSTFNKMRDSIDQQTDIVEEQVNKRTLQLRNVLQELRQRDEIIQKELDFASKIQRGIIPQSIPDWQDLSFRHFNRQKGKVGGDIFDVVQKDDSLLVYIADVSGHGVPAALITTMVKILFNDAILRFESPQDIVRYINKHIYRQLNQRKKSVNYFTAFTVMFNPNMNFAYVSAAHPKALHYRSLDKKVKGLDQRGCPMIGVFPDDRFDIEYGMGSFRNGDRMVIYSDGVVDQRNTAGDYYGVEQLSDVFANLGEQQKIEPIFSGIVGDFLNFSRGSLLGDDVTMLVISRDAIAQEVE